MAKLRFSLVSPERELFSGDVDQVDAPGSEGDFGVLAGHAPFMTTLKEGRVKAYDDDATLVFEVRGGFADVNAEGPDHSGRVRRRGHLAAWTWRESLARKAATEKHAQGLANHAHRARQPDGPRRRRQRLRPDTHRPNRPDARGDTRPARASIDRAASRHGPGADRHHGAGRDHAGPASGAAARHHRRGGALDDGRARRADRHHRPRRARVHAARRCRHRDPAGAARAAAASRAAHRPTAVALLSILQKVCIPSANGGNFQQLAKSYGLRKSGDSNWTLRQKDFTLIVEDPGSNPTQCHVDVTHPWTRTRPASRSSSR